MAFAGRAPVGLSVVRSIVPSGSRGFFLGPGRPRSLGGALGSMDGGARLRPVPGAPLLRFASALLGGARVSASATSVPFGTGVAFESDDLSACSDGCADGEGSFLIDGTAEARASGEAVSDGQLESWLDGMRSDTIRLFLPALGVDLVVMDMVSDGDGGGSGSGGGSEWVISVVMDVEVLDSWMDGASDQELATGKRFFGSKPTTTLRVPLFRLVSLFGSLSSHHDGVVWVDGAGEGCIAVGGERRASRWWWWWWW